MYRYEVERTDYSALASGFVLHSAPQRPAFPVRLTSEMFLRALALTSRSDPVTVWDPCCGSGYLLTVLALLHRPMIARVLASDIDEDALALTRRNLSLLSPAGLRARAIELAQRADQFGKQVYESAASTAAELERQLTADGGAVQWTARRASVFDPQQLAEVVAGSSPDVVLVDMPYGEQTHWSTDSPAPASPSQMVRALAEVLPTNAVIAMALRGRKIPLDPHIRSRGKFKIGTRAIALVQVADIDPA